MSHGIQLGPTAPTALPRIPAETGVAEPILGHARFPAFLPAALALSRDAVPPLSGGPKLAKRRERTASTRRTRTYRASRAAVCHPSY
jgi:hypothetical protein